MFFFAFPPVPAALLPPALGVPPGLILMSPPEPFVRVPPAGEVPPALELPPAGCPPVPLLPPLIVDAISPPEFDPPAPFVPPDVAVPPTAFGRPALPLLTSVGLPPTPSDDPMPADVLEQATMQATMLAREATRAPDANKSHQCRRRLKELGQSLIPMLNLANFTSNLRT